MAEQTAQIAVVRLLVEAQAAAVVHVLQQLLWLSRAERRERVLERKEKARESYFDLALHNPVVFLLLGSRVQPLPGKLPAHKIEEHVAQGLQVVAAALLDSQMVAEGSVARSARQAFIFSVSTSHAQSKRKYGMWRKW